MTQGNDHQQILWHGNKRKKYARIVLEQTSRMRKYKWGIFQIPSHEFSCEIHLIFPFYNYKHNDENQEEGKCLYNNYNEMVSNCEYAAHMLNRA